MIGETMNDIWTELLRRTRKFGHTLPSRDGACQELVGQYFRLENIEHNFITHPARKLSPIYAAAETLWYLSGRDDDTLVTYAPQYSRFLNNGRAHGAYGRRWVTDPSFETGLGELPASLDGKRVMSQLTALTTLLREKPDTRQAVLTMWNSRDLLYAVAGKTNDIPCTICIQFLVREKRLHAVTFMRSNDLWLGTPYDVFAFTTLQRLIADGLELGYGAYTHNVGSLHYYERNAKGVEDCCDTRSYGSIHPDLVHPPKYRPIPVGKTTSLVADAVHAELNTRKSGSLQLEDFPPADLDTVPGVLLACAASQFDPQAVPLIKATMFARRIQELKCRS